MINYIRQLIGLKPLPKLPSVEESIVILMRNGLRVEKTYRWWAIDSKHHIILCSDNNKDLRRLAYAYQKMEEEDN
jgi:hypothetical protein